MSTTSFSFVRIRSRFILLGSCERNSFVLDIPCDVDSFALDRSRITFSDW